jgi:spoIIIJ-associated protein
MVNFFSKLFGRGKAESGDAIEQVREALAGIIQRAGFDLSFDVKKQGDAFVINFSGADSELVTSRDGQLLDAFQIFVMRMLQNKFEEVRFEVQVDCDGFMEDSAQELRDLAEKLKKHVLEKGGASYVRALPPRERKVVHRYLAEDARIKSQSIGDGFCKKIKISLARESGRRDTRRDNETFV